MEIVVEELSTRLVKRGHKVDVYNRKGNNVQDKNADKDKKKLTEYNGIKIITIPTLKKKGMEALVYSFLATIKAIFGRYDIIHYHAEGPAAMLWIPHIFGIKTIATIHGLDWQRAKWGKFAKVYLKFGEKIAAKYADDIIVLSRNIQDYFKDTYNRETKFIPNGIEKPEFKEASLIKEKYNLSKDDYILYLGRIVPEKGVHYLIEAFKKCNTEKKLVIAGGSSHTDEYLEEVTNKAIEDKRIIMTGFVQGQELEELYSNCYAYCLPSDIEGMPMSLLEAMSYGKKCIISNIPENAEVAGKYAISFKRGDVNDLTDKINRVLDNKIEIKSDDIQKHILTMCDWEAVVSKIEKIYKEINK